MDGRSFHTYTKGLDRPYDVQFMEDMDATARYLCMNVSGTKLAFVQSDEISLVLTDFDRISTDAYFDGNVQKIASITAAEATAFFMSRRFNTTGELRRAMFDSRVFTIPSREEVLNYLIWRQGDATRNSIQMAGQAKFSHKELQGQNCDKIQEMLFATFGINWNNYPEGFKRGRLVYKKVVEVVTRFNLDSVSFSRGGGKDVDNWTPTLNGLQVAGTGTTNPTPSWGTLPTPIFTTPEGRDLLYSIIPSYDDCE